MVLVYGGVVSTAFVLGSSTLISLFVSNLCFVGRIVILGIQIWFDTVAGRKAK